MEQENLVKTSEMIYSSYGFSDSVGLAYFSKFTDRLEKLDFKDFLAHQVKTYPLRYVFDLLLSTPSLWTKIPASDWIKIMEKINPRPSSLKAASADISFSDIHFLCKYVGVNAVEIFLKEETFHNSDKKHVLQYCLRKACFFSVDEIDLEDLDGIYFMSQEEVEEAKNQLIVNGDFESFQMSESEFIQFIKNRQEKYH